MKTFNVLNTQLGWTIKTTVNNVLCSSSSAIVLLGNSQHQDSHHLTSVRKRKVEHQTIDSCAERFDLSA